MSAKQRAKPCGAWPQDAATLDCGTMPEVAGSDEVPELEHAAIANAPANPRSQRSFFDITSPRVQTKRNATKVGLKGFFHLLYSPLTKQSVA
jgi:hypothetical protein